MKSLLSIYLIYLITMPLAWGQNFPNVPGVVIDHLPKSARIFLGLPGIVILPDGKYVASHDIFGKGPMPQTCNCD